MTVSPFFFFFMNFLRSIHQVSHTMSSQLRCFYVFLMIRLVFCFFLIEIWLLYNVVFVSAVQWPESVYTNSLPHKPPAPPFIPPPRPWQSQLHSSFLLAVYFTHDHAYMWMLLSQFIFPSLVPHPMCPQAHNFASITALKIGSIFFFFQCQLGEV